MWIVNKSLLIKTSKKQTSITCTFKVIRGHENNEFILSKDTKNKEKIIEGIRWFNGISDYKFCT